MKNLSVMKIGGAVLNTPDNFTFLVDIIKNHCTQPTVFVFSAFSTLSRKLKEIGLTAKDKGLEFALLKFQEVKVSLTNLVNSLILDERLFYNIKGKLGELFDCFEKILFGISVTKELTSRTMDKLLSYGEYFSSFILEGYLKYNNINVEFLNSSELIITDSNYGNAKPIVEKTHKALEKNLHPTLEKANLVFLPGFVGTSENGTTTTMGFESSNLSALLVASLMGANSVIFWTDVVGIRSSDPKIVLDTLLVPEISFETARIASVNGLKLIHPSMYDFFVQNPDIEYCYKCAFDPDAGETRVCKSTQEQPMLLLISGPYYFTEHFFVQLPEFSNNAYFQQQASDFSFILKEENTEPIKENKKVSVITLLNVEPKLLHSALGMLESDLIFIYAYSKGNISKIFVQDSKVREIANFLHNFLILKK